MAWPFARKLRHTSELCQYITYGHQVLDLHITNTDYIQIYGRQTHTLWCSSVSFLTKPRLTRWNLNKVIDLALNININLGQQI